MGEFKHRFVNTNGIRMHVAESGEGYPVVMCHGFPELWYSWRHQMRALASAGLRAIAPDQRGYGETGGPEPIEAYTQREIVADLVGMLDAMGIEKCVVVGHDWGGVVAWNASLMAPARIDRVIALNTPFFPRTPLKPMDFIRAMAAGNFNYIVYFQEPGVAEEELERDVRRSLRSFYQGGELLKGGDLAELRKLPAGVLGPAGGGLLDHLPDLPHGAFLSDDDFEVFVRAFEQERLSQAAQLVSQYRSQLGRERRPARAGQPARADDHRGTGHRAAPGNGGRDADVGAEPAQDRIDRGLGPLDAAGEARGGESRDARVSGRSPKMTSRVLLRSRAPWAGATLRRWRHYMDDVDSRPLGTPEESHSPSISEPAGAGPAPQVASQVKLVEARSVARGFLIAAALIALADTMAVPWLKHELPNALVVTALALALAGIAVDLAAGARSSVSSRSLVLERALDLRRMVRLRGRNSVPGLLRRDHLAAHAI